MAPKRTAYSNRRRRQQQGNWQIGVPNKEDQGISQNQKCSRLKPSLIRSLGSLIPLHIVSWNINNVRTRKNEMEFNKIEFNLKNDSLTSLQESKIKDTHSLRFKLYAVSRLNRHLQRRVALLVKEDIITTSYEFQMSR